jgi:hypothetical protein
MWHKRETTELIRGSYGFAAMIMTRSTEIHQHFLSPFLRQQRGERAL